MKRIGMLALVALGLGLGFAQGAPKGKDVVAMLRALYYPVSFHYIPDKPAGKYKGREPHGATLRTYVNDIAFDAIRAKLGKYPVGALLVKENYDPTGEKLGAITVMLKTENFNQEGGGWFWLKYKPDGTVEAEGTPKGCVSCHSAVKGQDWVYSTEVK